MRASECAVSAKGRWRAGPDPPGQQRGHLPSPVPTKVSVWRPLVCTSAWRTGPGQIFVPDGLEAPGLPEFYHGLFKMWNLFKKREAGTPQLLVLTVPGTSHIWDWFQYSTAQLVLQV